MRGDANINAFEKWLYADETLEGALDADLYLDLIGCRFSNPGEVERIRPRIRAAIADQNDCECASIRNLNVIDMATDRFSEEFFKHFSTVKTPKDNRFWRRLDCCKACQEHWVIGVDNYFFDLYVVQRYEGKASHPPETSELPDWSTSYLNRLETALAISYKSTLRRYIAESTERQLGAGYTQSQVDGLMERYVAIIFSHEPDVTHAEISSHLRIKIEFSEKLLKTAQLTKKRIHKGKYPP